jgi:hypothetical protein
MNNSFLKQKTNRAKWNLGFGMLQHYLEENILQKPGVVPKSADVYAWFWYQNSLVLKNKMPEDRLELWKQLWRSANTKRSKSISKHISTNTKEANKIKSEEKVSANCLRQRRSRAVQQTKLVGSGEQKPVERAIRKSHLCGSRTGHNSTCGNVVVGYAKSCQLHNPKGVTWADEQGRYAFSGGKLRVGRSSIPASGDGVFTKVMLKQYDYITKYDGEIITAAEAEYQKSHANPEERKKHDYIMRARTAGGVFIQGITSPLDGKGLGSLLNSAGKSGKKNNCEFVWVNSVRSMYLRVTATYIFPGDELFAPYNRGSIDR